MTAAQFWATCVAQRFNIRKVDYRRKSGFVIHVSSAVTLDFESRIQPTGALILQADGCYLFPWGLLGKCAELGCFPSLALLLCSTELSQLQHLARGGPSPCNNTPQWKPLACFFFFSKNVIPIGLISGLTFIEDSESWKEFVLQH